MGDRTTVELTIRKQDRQKVLNKFGLQEFYSEFPVSTEGKDLVEVTMIEVNYGGWTELEELALEIDFVGSHEAGGTYGSFVFCSVETTELLGLETGYEGGFVIHFTKNPSGVLSSNMLDVQEYSRQHKLFTGIEPF